MRTRLTRKYDKWYNQPYPKGWRTVVDDIMQGGDDVAVKHRRVANEPEFTRYGTRHMPTDLLKLVKKFAIERDLTTEQAMVQLLRYGVQATVDA